MVTVWWLPVAALAALAGAGTAALLTFLRMRRTAAAGWRSSPSWNGWWNAGRSR